MNVGRNDPCPCGSGRKHKRCCLGKGSGPGPVAGRAGPGDDGVSCPDTWAAWGLPDALVARVFEAAADFHRAAPWEVLFEDEEIEVALPGGATWHVAVAGASAQLPGLLLYADAEDVSVGEEYASLEELAGWLTDRHYALLFADRRRLPRPMQREIAARGWTVAGPDACPRLLALNAPDSGPSREDGEDLAAVLRAVAALVREREEEILEGRWRRWRDPGTGATLSLTYDGGEDFGAGSWSEGFVVPDFVEEMLDEDERAELRELLGRAEAPSVGEVNAVFSRFVERHNRAPRVEFGGLSPEQVEALLDADWSEPGGPLTLERSLSPGEAGGARLFRNARTFLDALVESAGTRATSAGNLNRAFVREMMEALEWPDGWGRTYLEERRKVVNEEDFWALHTLRVLLDLAGLIKKRKGTWTATRRGEKLRADEEAGELYARLFETHFRTFNLGYLDRVDHEGEFQHGIAYSLHRYREAGREWRTRDELVDELLLPLVRHRIPVRSGFDAAPVLVETRFLDPLERFGLAEREEVEAGPGRGPRHRYRKTPLYDRFLRFGV